MKSLKKIKPMFTSIITTMDLLKEEDTLVQGTNLISSAKLLQSVSPYQRVLAVGSSVREVKVGDWVCIDPTRFGKPLHNLNSLQETTIKDNPMVEYIFDTMELNGEKCLFLQDRDIRYIIEEFGEEMNKPEPIVYVPKKRIIS